MARRLCAVILTVAIPLATIYAPPVHVHVAERGSHRVVHAHAPTAPHAAALPSAGPQLHQPRRHGQTFVLHLFVAHAATPFAAAAINSPTFEITPPTCRGIERVTESARGHDPPRFAATAPRAPPAVLA